MAKVICTLYSRHFDRRTGVEFRPELVGGRYVGVAKVEDAKVLRLFKGREGFEVVEEPKKAAKSKSEPTGKKGEGQDGPEANEGAGDDGEEA